MKAIRLSAFLILLFTCFSSQITGQRTEVTKKNIHQNGSDVFNQIDSINLLSRNLVFIDPAKSLDYANKALKLSINNRYEEGTAESYRILSGIYSYFENYSLSLEFNQAAYDIFSELNDSAGIANCYISLGHIYKGLGQKESELDFHKKSYEIYSRLKNPERMGVTSYNLGESCYNNGDTAGCRKMILLSVKINESLSNLPVLSACFNVLGKLELDNKSLENAKGYFNRVLEIKSKLGPESQKIATKESIMSLAAISKIQNNRRDQLIYLKMAEDFCLENNLNSFLKSVYLDLIQYYSEMNDAGSVRKYLEVYKNIQDSIDRQQLSHMYNLTRNIPVVHELSLQKNRLEKENLMHLQKIRERNIILVSALFSIFLLCGLLISIFSSNKKLKIQKATIEHQSKQLEILNNTKDKFFGIISHDLRSPLNSIKTVSMLLAEFIDKMDKSKIIKLSQELGTTVDNTIRMTENLSNWARIQMKDFKTVPERVNLKEIVSPVYEVYKEVAQQKEIDLICEFAEDLTVFGDKNQIEFILRNLVNNAIKYTKRGGRVELQAKSINDNRVQIIVSDNGIGIPEKLKNELFNLGKHHVSYGTEEEKGTGLGLILCNDFLKLNNGQMEIDSTEGLGTTVSVTLINGLKLNTY